MKILKLHDFLGMPEGTLFAQGTRWDFDNIEIKCESIVLSGKTVGYWANIPAGIISDDMEDMDKRMTEMLDKGASYPMDNACTKCIGFTGDELFLVFERDDLIRLRGWIDAAIGLTEGLL